MISSVLEASSPRLVSECNVYKLHVRRSLHVSMFTIRGYRYKLLTPPLLGVLTPILMYMSNTTELLYLSTIPLLTAPETQTLLLPDTWSVHVCFDGPSLTLGHTPGKDMQGIKLLLRTSRIIRHLAAWCVRVVWL